MTIDELSSRFQQKDQLAFQTLYQKYSTSMHGVIYRIVRNQEVAEEVLQDVFVKAWNNAETYSVKKGRIFTWLLNISRNAAIDRTRSKDYKTTYTTTDSSFFTDILEDHDNLNSRTDTIGLRKFVTSLKEQCQRLIELLYFKGYTQKEASEDLRIPIGTVKTNNKKCITDLRKVVLN